MDHLLPTLGTLALLFAAERVLAIRRARAASVRSTQAMPSIHHTSSLQHSSRSTAILLALFLGGLGAHKFYLRKPLWGCLYLAFCWTLVPAILGGVEAVCYALMGDGWFNRSYNRGC